MGQRYVLVEAIDPIKCLQKWFILNGRKVARKKEKCGEEQKAESDWEKVQELGKTRRTKGENEWQKKEE